MRKKLFIFLLFLLSSQSWGAVTLTAKTDKTALTMDDKLTLTVELNGAQGTVVMPQLPSLPAFNVYAPELYQSVINGYATTQFRYTLTPRFEGKAVIGPVSLTYGGKTYKTSPIDVTVYRSAARMPAATARTPAAAAEKIPDNLPPLTRSLMLRAQQRAPEDFFLVAAVSNTSPYVNQPVTMGIRFYYAKQFDEGPYTDPSVTNMFMEELDSTTGTQTIAGKKYYYVEKRNKISAPTAGKATIGSASVQFTVSRIPGLGRFDHLLGGLALGEERTVKSTPITLNVQPLPEQNRPESFYGAVGQHYTITAQTDRTTVEAGEAVNLTVTVKGSGNLKATSDLKFPPINGLRVYDAATSSGQLPGKLENQSYKTFKTVLVPSASGEYTVPSLEWSYFNPVLRQYSTLHTNPIALHVTPATKTDTNFDFSNNRAENGFRTLNTDIAYVKTQAAPAAQTILHKAAQEKQLSWYFIGLLALCALYRLMDKKTLTRKRAFTHAAGRLKKAKQAQDIAGALADYLNEKCRLNAASTPLKELLPALQKHGMQPETAQQFALLWKQLDAARFAPVAMEADGLRALNKRGVQILKRLEGELKCRA